MSSYSNPIALLALIQLITIVITRNLQVSCPQIPGPTTQSDANPLLSGSEIQDLSLNPSCFAMDIRLNVENILPDPSYIVRETNVDIIYNAVQKTLNDNNIHAFNIVPVDDKSTPWSINNNCPHQKDETVNKFYLQKTPHNILCDENSLVLKTDSIECEFTTPESIAYIFNIESVQSLFEVSGWNVIIMNAIIMDMDKHILLESETKTVTNANQMQQFVFSKTSNTLTQNTKYLLRISVVGGTNVEIHSVQSTPTIITTAQANACHLAYNIADDKQMRFALKSLCNSTNIENRKLFERVFYQQHSSQNYVYLSSMYGARRRLLDYDSTEGTTETGSLHLVTSNGTRRLIATDAVFPDYGQCVAIDRETLRLFSVGGHSKSNGVAMDRLAMYQINQIHTAYLLQDNLKLDVARTGAMCYYYENKNDNNKQYIIAINGMNTKDDNNINNWYNDIVFIGADGKFNVPKIQLKHNVIDMTPIVTETNELYLFGGRDGKDAINYIQTLDLNQVLDPNTNKKEFTSIERMEPMVSNLVIPFIDFVMLEDKVCIMIFGGQDYVNNEWIDIETYPNNKLQLYCNDRINKTNFDRMNYLTRKHHFTAFDREHLKNVDNFNGVKTSSNIFMSEYNFKNDDILYEFSATFQLCFDNLYNMANNEYLTTILNVFDKDTLTRNILTESQRNFQRWNDGFGAVNISDIHIIEAESTPIVNDCIGLSESVCESVVIASSNGAVNGDQKCAYNTQTNNCYSIERRAAGTNNGNKDSETNHSSFGFMTQSKLYSIVAVLFGIVIALLLFIIGAAFYIYNKEKTGTLVQDAVAMEFDMVETQRINRINRINTNSTTQLTELNTDDIYVR